MRLNIPLRLRGKLCFVAKDMGFGGHCLELVLVCSPEPAQGFGSVRARVISSAYEVQYGQ
ncbi:hypothetical protein SynROS8604_02622 [Synechococcus sp. ROS8604]|nr:hypothetical protein SynROS8604_02622 [Synechococcus sp. ROS8604]